MKSICQCILTLKYHECFCIQNAISLFTLRIRKNDNTVSEKGWITLWSTSNFLSNEIAELLNDTLPLQTIQRIFHQCPCFEYVLNYHSPNCIWKSNTKEHGCMISMIHLETREANSQYLSGIGRACTLKHTRTDPLLIWAYTLHSAFYGTLHGPGTVVAWHGYCHLSTYCYMWLLQETLTRLGLCTVLLEVEEGLWFSPLKVCKHLIIA